MVHKPPLIYAIDIRLTYLTNEKFCEDELSLILLRVRVLPEDIAGWNFQVF